MYIDPVVPFRPPTESEPLLTVTELSFRQRFNVPFELAWPPLEMVKLPGPPIIVAI